MPAKFLDDEGPRADLKGTFTVLGDSGMTDEEILVWLFTPDATLPVEGAPIDALSGRSQDRDPPPGDGAGPLSRRRARAHLRPVTRRQG